MGQTDDILVQYHIARALGEQYLSQKAAAHRSIGAGAFDLAFDLAPD